MRKSSLIILAVSRITRWLSESASGPTSITISRSSSSLCSRFMASFLIIVHSGPISFRYQSSRNFSHSLGPSTGRVRHQCYVIAHVPVVLRYRNSSVDAGLSRGNGHVRSIRDQYRPVHDGLAASRVHKLRKRFQHFRHLVSSLAAAHVDNDGGVCPFCELLLGHSFSGPEGAGDGCGASLCDWEEEIDYALAS